MNRATRITASSFGVYAGLLGAAHGYFETLQGSVAPDGIMINAIGPPCQADEVSHACLPAMTIVPNFFITGVLALIVGLTIALWAAGLVQRKNGGVVLILLSSVLLPVGGGFLPAFYGIIAGIAGTRINTSFTWWRARLSTSSIRVLANLWPWSLVVYFLWVPAEWVLGYFSSEFLLEQSSIILLSTFGVLVLAVLTAFARDIHKQTDSCQSRSTSERDKQQSLEEK